jgi:hypothetical protein
MKQRFCLLLLCIFSGNISAQSKGADVLISNGVFLQEPEIKEVCDLWQNYLHSNPDSLYDNPHWNTAEKRQFKNFDLLTQTEIQSIYIYLHYYKPTILSITPEGKYYRIRTLFAMTSDSGFSDPIAITNVYAKRDSGSFRLYNSLPIVTHSWQHHTIGEITFICPPSHTFDEKKARKLSSFVSNMAKELGMPPKPCQYYFANSVDELFHAQGLDYYIGEGNKIAPAGFSDVKNAILYGGGSDEWYPHEFVHLYAMPKYPKADSYFQEGLAVLLGGSHGHSIDWHIRHADSLLTARKDFNIDSALADSWRFANLDYLTGSEYLFGGLLCKMTMEKGGWPLVKNMMSYGPKPEDGRFKVLNDFFGVERKDSAAFLRKKISDYAATIPPDIQ